MIRKFFYMLSKDTKIFCRDIRSFALLFLTPIFIVLLVGIAFLSTQPSHVPVIACTEDKTSDLYRDTLLLLRSSGVFDISEREGDCKEIISQQIKNSDVRAGIIVPQQSANSTVEIMIDNTKPVSTYIESYFNLITKDLSQKLINAVMADMWSNVGNVSQQIDYIHAELISYSQTLGGASSDLDASNAAIAGVKGKISSIKNAKASIDSSITEVQMLDGNIASISSSIETIDEKRGNIERTLGYLNISSAAFYMLSENITMIEDNLASIRNTASAAETSINAIEISLRNAQSILENANTDEMEMRMTNAANSLSSASVSIKQVKGNIDSLANRLMVAKNTLLREQDKYKPVYSEPVNSRITRYFGNKRYIDFIFPTILVMILMLMSTFLSATSFIRQRSMGLLKRISISTTGSNFLLFEKMIFNAFVSLIPLPFILAAGSLVLGIQINVNNAIPIVFVCSILSIVFVLIGLIIASFSRTESTAILASLIFVVPMMFLSGAFTPYEALPPGLQIFAASMPITISTRLIEGLTFYQLPMDMMGVLVASLFFYIVALFLIGRLLVKRGI